MSVSREERNRILTMLGEGQISAEDAVQLFDALAEEPVKAPPKERNHTLRVWITDMTTRSRKVNMTATLPLEVLHTGLQALGQMMPRLRAGRMEEIVYALEHGVSGRVMDLQDLEDGKRIEIFIEQ